MKDVAPSTGRMSFLSPLKTSSETHRKKEDPDYFRNKMAVTREQYNILGRLLTYKEDVAESVSEGHIFCEIIKLIW